MLQPYDYIIRASIYGSYTSSDIQAYQTYVSGGGKLLLASEYLRPSSVDALADAFGVHFAGISRGDNRVDRFNPHRVTAGVTPLRYIAGSGITNYTGPIEILGYLSDATYLDLNDNGVQDSREPVGAPVLAATEYGAGRIVFYGDLNSLEGVPQPLIDNIFRWLGDLCSGTDDTDGDGLLDVWELCGYDADGDDIPDVDLPAMGADPLHKDIFVEIDAMENWGACGDGWCQGHSHRPKPAAITLVVDAFDDAPVSNPDGSTGIHLHIDDGPDAPLTWGNAATWGALSAADSLPDQEWLQPTDTVWDWSAFDTFKQTYFAPERRPIFHYALFVSNLGGDIARCTPGISRNDPAAEATFREGASDFAVSLGCYPALWAYLSGDGVGNVLQQAGTLMHQLGHNLGLPHGGDDFADREPNHLSVMNTAFQMQGLIKQEEAGYFDYARFANIPSLDETNLDETVGLNAGADLDDYGTRYYCWIHDWVPVRGIRVNHANAPIDWNCWDGPSDTNVVADINGDGVFATLSSWNEWDHLAYSGGYIGDTGNTTLSLPAQPAEAMDENPYAVYANSARPYDVVLRTRIPDAHNVVLLTVGNQGERPATIQLTYEVPDGLLDLAALPDTLNLEPDTDASFPLTITAPIADLSELATAVFSATIQQSPRVVDRTALQIHSGIRAWYTMKPSPAVSLSTVTFTDLSFGPVVAWAWDFGDGSSSADQHPMHTYAQPGKYTIILTVTGVDGEHSFSRTYTVPEQVTTPHSIYLPLTLR